MVIYRQRGKEKRVCQFIYFFIRNFIYIYPSSIHLLYINIRKPILYYIHTTRFSATQKEWLYIFMVYIYIYMLLCMDVLYILSMLFDYKVMVQNVLLKKSKIENLLHNNEIVYSLRCNIRADALGTMMILWWLLHSDSAIYVYVEKKVYDNLCDHTS